MPVKVLARFHTDLVSMTNVLTNQTILKASKPADVVLRPQSILQSPNCGSVNRS